MLITIQFCSDLNSNLFITFLLVEDRQARAGALGVPDADAAVGRAGSQAMVGCRVGQPPDTVLVPVQHTAFDARVWRGHTHTHTHTPNG